MADPNGQPHFLNNFRDYAYPFFSSFFLSQDFFFTALFFAAFFFRFFITRPSFYRTSSLFSQAPEA